MSSCESTDKVQASQKLTLVLNDQNHTYVCFQRASISAEKYDKRLWSPPFRHDVPCAFLQPLYLHLFNVDPPTAHALSVFLLPTTHAPSAFLLPTAHAHVLVLLPTCAFCLLDQLSSLPVYIQCRYSLQKVRLLILLEMCR